MKCITRVLKHVLRLSISLPIVPGQLVVFSLYLYSLMYTVLDYEIHKNIQYIVYRTRVILFITLKS